MEVEQAGERPARAGAGAGAGATTVIVSDLHVGARSKRALVTHAGPRARLLQKLAAADRVVLLGDLLELREAPLDEVMGSAAPFLRKLADACRGREVVLVPGNHDHALVEPWLHARRNGSGEPPGLDGEVPISSSPLLGRLARLLDGAELRVRYPGVWLRGDVYASHLHYLDLHLTVPSFERLAIGARRRLAGETGDPRGVEGYEVALRPIYSWLFQRAQTAGPGDNHGPGASARAWELVAGGGGRSPASAALSAVIPVAVGALNRAGLGPLRAELTGEELRRAGLRAAGEVCRVLGIDAEHVIGGHTHRTGPLPGDDLAEWVAPTGVRLMNAGSWIWTPALGTSTPDNPYWPGGCVVVEAQGPPRLERLLADATPETILD